MSVTENTGRHRVTGSPDERLLGGVQSKAPSTLTGNPDLALINLILESGLRGRGGASFPTGRKLEAVAKQRKKPIVVVNASEGEPASFKDETLLRSFPHLVLDGALWAAQAVGAKDVIICLKQSGLDVAVVVEGAIAQRKRVGERASFRIEYVPDRFVVGEESALVNWINTKTPRPTLRPPMTFERGVNGRPTLVDNAETLAHLGLIATHGSNWFRQRGTLDEPGTMLVTLGGAFERPGVREIAIGTPLADVMADAGVVGQPKAVLMGGYFGTWISWSEAQRVHMSNESLKIFGSALGCGVIHALPENACGVRESARVLNWMSTQSAGQCGSCVNGLASVAELTGRIYLGKAPGNAIEWLDRWANQIAGRGACRLPDGAIRFMQSALRVFATDIAAHRSGKPCPGSRQATILPLPGKE